MKKMKKLVWIACALLLVLGSVSAARSQPPGSSEGVLVGRITHVTGKLLRYVPEEKDWVVTVKDAPFGINDALYSDREGKAEFVMPNATLIRVGGDTQVQLIAVQSEVTEVDVASGMARFYNKSGDAVIKATTPFGYVVAWGGTVFDLYVGDQSVELIALKGTVEFVLESDQTRYEATAGSSSVLSDGKRVAPGEGNVDADWDDWNAERDSLWTKKAQVKGDSVKYIPPPLYDDANDLDEHGRWERVYYEGGYHEMWRPTEVHSGWRPYTVGRWTEYYEDQCWVPAEPFGYVTHHYGNWVYANDFWYWAPPLLSVGVSVGPAVGLGFGWYPGRVGWVGAGVNLGWFPLAASEPYYSHYNWGPGAMVVNSLNINAINININNYRYADYGVAVPYNQIYAVNNYYGHNIVNINKTTIINNNYVASPFVNNRIFADYNANRQRFAFTNAVADVKPHHDVFNRIAMNQNLARTTGALSAAAIASNVSRFRQGTADRNLASQLQRPTVSNRLVRPADVNRPRSDLQFDQRQLKSRTRAAQESPVTRLQGLDTARGKSRGPVGTVAPGQTIQPGVGRSIQPGVGTQPGQPGQIRTPLDRGQRGGLPGAGPQGQPGPADQIKPPLDRGQRVRPAGPPLESQPGTQGQPGLDRGKPGRGRPGLETQPGTPGQPDQMRGPVDRGQRGKPGGPPQEVQPGTQGQPGLDRGKPGSGRPGIGTQPGTPGQPDQMRGPVDRGQRVRPTGPPLETQPGTQGQPGLDRGKPGSGRPGIGTQPGTPGQPDQIRGPVDRGQRGKPGGPPQEVQPGTPSQQGNPPGTMRRPAGDPRMGSRPPQDQVQPQGRRGPPPDTQMGGPPKGTQGGGGSPTPRGQMIERRPPAQEQQPQMQRGRQVQQPPPQLQRQPQPAQQRPPQGQQPQQQPQQKGKKVPVGPDGQPIQ